jgi:EAL domain-containing protein (putative c-di-GMP-specific phosphodiesterase class I)
VPYTIYHTGIAWRTDQFDPDFDAMDNPWDVFWDPQLVTWQREDLTDVLSMSVNVSITQLQRPEFVDQLTQIIEETGISPAHLIPEVTESVLAQQPPDVAAALAHVRALGVRVALDDFGSGYSSMSQLQRLRSTRSRSTRSSSRPSATTTRARTRWSTRCSRLGHSMGLRTVAEGVEHLDQFDALVAQECDIAQGFLFARPRPPSEALDFLRTFRLPVRRSTGVDEAVTGTGE